MSAYYNARTRKRQRVPVAELKRQLEAGKRFEFATQGEAAAFIARLGAGLYSAVTLHDHDCSQVVSGDCDCTPSYAVEELTKESALAAEQDLAKWRQDRMS